MTFISGSGTASSWRRAATGRAVALLAAGLLATAGAFAEKKDAGDGKHDKPGKHAQKEKHDKQVYKNKDKPNESARGEAVRVGGYFHNDQRTLVHTYYNDQFRTGRCPPGLAKKNNGCMPPGQARKWAVGQHLPREVVYYPVPTPVLVHLGPAPQGHRYVRVATDILLIATGTRMVIDAIEDLGRI